MVSYLFMEGVRTWATWKSAMKKSICVAGFAAEATAAFSRHCVQKGAQSRYLNIEDARKALVPIGIEDEEHFQ